MSIIIRVNMLRATYHGRGSDGRVQWPPDPVRLLAALKAGAHALDNTDLGLTAHQALDLLATTKPPTISAPPHVWLKHPPTYTERTGLTDKLSAKHEDKPERQLTLTPFAMDSRNRIAKPRDGVALAGHFIDYGVEVCLSSEETDALIAASRNIPYFGRSEDPAVIEVLPKTTASQMANDLRLLWYPYLDRQGLYRGWQANTIEWMNTNYERVFSNNKSQSSYPGQLSNTQLPPIPATGYVVPLDYRTVAPAARRPVLHTFPLQKAQEQYRTPKLLSRLRKHIPAGWQILPLTASSHPLSNGQLLGIGVYPVGEETLTAIGQPGFQRLHDELGDPLALHRQRSTLDSETWTRSSRWWTSSTPLRAFPNLVVVEDALNAESQRRFGCSVRIVEATTHERSRRDHRWPNSEYLDGHCLWWLTVQFDKPVAGPLQMGSTIEDGFGVFLPNKR